MKTSHRRTLKTITTGALAAAMLAMGAAAASAHVNVDPDDPAANGYTHLTFNVPNESPTAKTSKLVVSLPADTPFTSVSVKPLDGWTVQVITTALPKPVTLDGTTVTKAPSSVVWTADAAHEIGQNEYQTFSLSVGKLPAAGTTITLPATQTYTDGTVVNWNEKTVEGQTEPDHPAPSFVTTAEDGTATTPPVAVSTPDNSTGVWGMVFGGAGLLLGGTALGLVLAGRRKSAALQQ
ncbi:nuclear export factor GLE1 [Arthrobacter sp. ERGS1:01]|uniref:YcnI family copper-binding membrane protein n=1 Tax=Arthrobacter sp. ERGS1:01 TaxID=1704044 RepID=UPI0006B44ED9|nr:YcnI family protein [Arthrobacter sp. ERGS1:01]ALE06018.1 nuclear export factor GLE1 [Arthrobacter sp. ERGS1:01]